MIIATKGPGFVGKTKHIRSRYFFVKQHVDNGDVALVYKETESMVADMLTKPLIGANFRRFRAEMMGHAE